MTENYSGKRVFVSGSSSGIGLEIAKRFLSFGCFVGINGRNLKQLDQAATLLQSDKFLICPGDVGVFEEASIAVENFNSVAGGIDTLICNAGISRTCDWGEESESGWWSALRGNLSTATNLVELFRDKLAESSGNVVCISSICGVEAIAGAPISYSVSKAALNSYIKVSARHLGQLGVRINAVAPGNIIFDGSVWEKKLNDDAEKVTEMLRRNVPIERFGDPNDIADLVVWLASPMAKNVTGSIMISDGGQTVGF